MPVNEGMAKAYMMLHGTSFFESARISNNLLHRNKRAKQIYGEICCEWIFDRPHYMSDKLKVLIPNPQTEQ
uniref:Uncharacterized protein n=1 Tax=Trichogramma kaykai TaxID=54128 RepID=A0ABD2WWT0_9HYME